MPDNSPLFELPPVIPDLPWYQYSQIDLATDGIRLVRLIRGKFAYPIRCELVQTYLSELGIPYQALSYTWGDRGDPQDIQLSDVGGAPHRHRINKSLFEVMRHIREPEEDKYLWIDAVCIDQENTLERGHQVGQMRLIYQNAEEVLIWLGPLKTVERQFFMERTSELDRQMKRLPRSVTNKNPEEEMRKLVKSTFWWETMSDIFAKGLTDLLLAPWFRRVWVVQEAASARRATIRCGSLSVSSRTFAIMPSFMGICPSSFAQAVLEVMPGPLRAQSWFSEKRTLSTLLRKFSDSLATDQRDKIYALLGIAQDARDLRPSYEIPMSSVIQRTIWHLLFPNEPYDSEIILPQLGFAQFMDCTSSPWPSIMAEATEQVGSIRTSESAWFKLWDCRPEDYNGPFIDAGAKPLLHLMLENREMPLHLFQAVLGEERFTWLDAQNTFYGSMPLEPILKRHDMDILKAFLSHPGVDSNAISVDGLSFLAVAVSQNFEEGAKLLTEKEDIDVNATDTHMPPLVLAAKYGNTNILRQLLSHHDIDVNKPSSVEGLLLSPLATAVQNAFSEGIDLLMEHKDIDINAQRTSNPPLAIAVQCGNMSAVRKLLQDERLELGRLLAETHTAIDIAVEMRRQDILQLLLEKCRRMSIEEQSIIIRRIARGINESTPDPNPLDTGAVGYVHSRDVGMVLAAQWGLEDLFFSYLRETRYSIDAPNRALFLAAMNGHESIVERLVAAEGKVRGTSIEFKGSGKTTPLMASTLRGHISTVRILLKNGAKMHASDASNRTPLKMAVSKEHFDIARLLLEHGADPSVVKKSTWHKWAPHLVEDT